MSFRTATDVVVACENVLGYALDTSKQGLRQARQVQAGILKKAMARNPDITFDDLELALAWSYAKRQPVRTPAGLLYRVKEAKELAGAPPPVVSAVSATVEAALSWELAQSVPDHGWIGKLTRAHGPAREDLLRDWTGAGRGQ